MVDAALEQNSEARTRLESGGDRVEGQPKERLALIRGREEQKVTGIKDHFSRIVQHAPPEVDLRSEQAAMTALLGEHSALGEETALQLGEREEGDDSPAHKVLEKIDELMEQDAPLRLSKIEGQTKTTRYLERDGRNWKDGIQVSFYHTGKDEVDEDGKPTGKKTSQGEIAASISNYEIKTNDKGRIIERKSLHVTKDGEVKVITAVLKGHWRRSETLATEADITQAFGEVEKLHKEEKEKIEEERVNSSASREIIPTVEGDRDSGVDFAYFRWHPTSDYTQVGQTEGLGQTRFNTSVVPRAPVTDQPYALRFQQVEQHGKTVPIIAYSFRADDGTEGRDSLASVALTSDRLTPELALRLVDPTHTHNQELRGWMPGKENPLDPRKEITERQSLNVAQLKEYQLAQQEANYSRLQNPEVRDKMVKLLTSILQQPSQEGKSNALYMYNTNESDAHAMLYTLFDMLSQTSDLRKALGPLTFTTNFGEMPPASSEGIQLAFSSRGVDRFGSPKPDMARRAPIEGPFASAAQILINTFLAADHDPSRVADLVQKAGTFDPTNPEAWCRNLLAAA